LRGKVNRNPRIEKMEIQLARHYGMCFGVRDALRHTHDLATSRPTTVLGELVHNPLVSGHLETLGVRSGRLEDPASSTTEAVVITAHGAAESDRRAWSEAGHSVFDTTCPLVKKAHRSLEVLVLAGFFPVVIGQRDHVEVRGLITDFPEAVVILDPQDMAAIPGGVEKIGVASQTTQPIDRVEKLVSELEARFPESEVRFLDTVCQPTKDRQQAIHDLCRANDTIVVVGGMNSNNTRQLVETARLLGCRAHQVESAADLERSWFRRSKRVGVTAGTSTLDETVHDVVERLRMIKRRF
jgi:4-hydroxy-3-methylbut-2-enyl diphosphate reductase